MLELLVSICLASEPSQCKEVSLVYAADSATPFQCMMGAPSEIAKWADEHPKWLVKRWTCQTAGLTAKL